MAIFGKNGFMRRQEIGFAKKLLVWKYEKSGMVVPDEAVLSAHAQNVVDEAHIIAKNTGSNVFEILKESVKSLKNKG